MADNFNNKNFDLHDAEKIEDLKFITTIGSQISKLEKIVEIASKVQVALTNVQQIVDAFLSTVNKYKKSDTKKLGKSVILFLYVYLSFC